MMSTAKAQTVPFPDALSRARSALSRLGVPEVLPRLHATGIGISRNVLGGSHSVAIYPPIDSLEPLGYRDISERIDFGGETSLYVHIAFCETRCTFCHYAVQQLRTKDRTLPAELTLVKYLAALREELKYWGNRLAKTKTVLSSIYIGGGTPLLLEQEALRDLIDTIKSGFRIAEGADICLEGSPLSLTADNSRQKLCFLKRAGITRLSFGAQSFDDTVLKYAARGYTGELAIQAARIVDGIFENWNVDLIQGLYMGSPQETWENLRVIASVRPPHLTWYHARFADRPQGHWYKTESKRSNFEDEYTTLVGRMLIWQGMEAIGYRQIDGNRFVRKMHFIDPFKGVRTSVSRNLLGVGAASYSHVTTGSSADGCYGYIFRNQPEIEAYIEAVSAGIVPITTGRRITAEEVLAASYATGLRFGRVEDANLRLIRTTLPSLSEYYDNLERRLRDLGLLEPYDSGTMEPGLRLSRLGRLLEDETLFLFFSPTVQRSLAAHSA